jgi:hypothetical protein
VAPESVNGQKHQGSHFSNTGLSLFRFGPGTFEKIKTDREKAFRLLFEYGAETVDSRIPIVRNWGSSLAYFLHHEVPVHFVRSMIEYGLDLNCPTHYDRWPRHPLEITIQRYSLEVTKLLVQKGANVDILRGKDLY